MAAPLDSLWPAPIAIALSNVGVVPRKSLQNLAWSFLANSDDTDRERLDGRRRAMELLFDSRLALHPPIRNYGLHLLE